MSGRNRARGQLEAEVMRILWDHEDAIGARRIQEGFGDGNVPAYTTLLTVLDRLERKGEVDRVATSPRKVRFRPTRSDGERAGAAMLSALEATGDRAEALARFAGQLTANDIEMLERALRSKHTARR
ncbi:putative transcriptional regulator [Promicromonospora umidemergens]|uniref:BlaI/MecI/CopY family transcriptional regulator n=1 Tax=Promicromonospora umidemergens TaxID=629679 RepID=A0ABP8YDE7_9MICO|nr:BlaI/MecI/CopY family transcriptional regulator [Promicromonospora umidemergens]MCP2282251.1 putative transcriptional regulator [Promicromonospora umidemergens]